MADMTRPAADTRGKAFVVRSYAAECADCQCVSSDREPSMKAYRKTLLARGWVQVPNVGWVCQVCVQARDKGGL
jgi:hypothetical protein